MDRIEMLKLHSQHDEERHPRFSVIIPVYNVARYLRECLDSVVAAVQRYGDSVEVIAVDDGSRDGSGELLDNWASEHQKDNGLLDTIIVHQANAGVCAARNMGLERVRGDWIVFVDADDVVHEQFFEFFSQIIEHYPKADMIRSGVKIFMDGEWQNEPFIVPPGGIEYDLSQVVPPAVFYGSLWGGYRTDIHGKHRFGIPVKLKIGEDNLYLTQACELSQCAVIIDKVLYGYRQRSGSAYHSERTTDFWRNDLAHYYEVLKIFEISQKRFSASIIREYSMRITEGYSDYLSKRSVPDYQEKWELLLEFFDKAGRFSKLPKWSRFVMRVCALTHSRLVYHLLCRLPRKLKLGGLHR